MENISEIISNDKFNILIIVCSLFITSIIIGYFINNRINLKLKKRKEDEPIAKLNVYENTTPLKCEKGECKVKEEEEDNIPVPNNIMRSKEVFNISKNIYTYHDAKALCKALDSNLATFEQVQEAYKNGADWCNYGWTKGQMALYPTQKHTWDKLQKGNKKFRNECGHPGINGGHFDNPHLKFGVNCYGNKPELKDVDRELLNHSPSPRLTDEEKRKRRKIREFRSERERNKIAILPFRKKVWNSNEIEESNFTNDFNKENKNEEFENKNEELKNIDNFEI